MYTLQIRVVNGRNLPAADLNGYSDPYVKIYWGGNMVKTGIKKKTLNPYWDELYSLSSRDPWEDVKLNVYDHDRFTRDDHIGGGVASTKSLTNGVETSITVQLHPRGEILVRLKPIDFPASSAPSIMQSSAPPIGPQYQTTTLYQTTYTTPQPAMGEYTVDQMIAQRYNSGGFPTGGGLMPPPSYQAPPQGMMTGGGMYGQPAPQPMGYPPQSGGYPPQQGGLMPPGGMYAAPPPQTGGYPPQGMMPGGGMYGQPMPQTGGYPQQTGGYPPQMGGSFPPQTGGYPQQGGFAPQTGGYPQQGGFAPQQGGFAPQQGGLTPGGGYPPPSGGYPPQGYGRPY